MTTACFGRGFLRIATAYAWCGIVLGLVAAGCDWDRWRGHPTDEPPVVGIRNMYNQPRYDPQERSPFFEDETTMRPPVPGTVSREEVVDVAVATGRVADGARWIAEVPAAVVRRFGGMQSVLQRGEGRFNIYCAPCHGMAGYGDGPIAMRAEQVMAAALKPPTFHDERLRHVPDGQIFAVITHGIRNMPAYGHSIPPMDRWAIVSYLRALQLSQYDASQEQAASTDAGAADAKTDAETDAGVEQQAQKQQQQRGAQQAPQPAPGQGATAPPSAEKPGQEQEE